MMKRRRKIMVQRMDFSEALKYKRFTEHDRKIKELESQLKHLTANMVVMQESYESRK